MTESLPFIRKDERKYGSSGALLEEKCLIVQGKDLKECEKIFNKKWKDIK